MSKLREAAQHALERLRISAENMREGMSPALQKAQAEFHDEAIGELVQALNGPSWVDLTTAEEKTMWTLADKKPSAFARLLVAKFKEKNS